MSPLVDATLPGGGTYTVERGEEDRPSGFAPRYLDDAETYTDRGSVLTISRNLADPTSLQPTVWVNVSGKGDNATFKGVCAGQFLARDRSDVDATTNGVLYALQAVVAPIVDRDNVPYDDVVGLSIENQGSAKGTDALYFGKARSDKVANPTALDWANIVANDANAATFIKTSGTHDVGLSFSAATITTYAIRLGNNQAIAANKSNGDGQAIIRLSAAGTLRLAEGAGGIDIRASFGGIYPAAKVVMPNDTPIYGIRYQSTSEYELIKVTSGDNVSIFAARATVLAGGGLVLADCTGVPSAPTGGVVIYSESGVLKAKVPGGAITTLTP